MSQQVPLLPSGFLSIHLLSMRETELADESRRVEIFSFTSLTPLCFADFNREELASVPRNGGETDWLQNQDTRQ